MTSQNFKTGLIKSQNINVWYMGAKENVEECEQVIKTLGINAIVDMDEVPDFLENLDLYGYFECKEPGYEADVARLNKTMSRRMRLISDNTWMGASLLASLKK